MKIGIDIDGVLLDLEQFLQDYGTKFNYENNLPMKITPGDYNEANVFEWSEEEILKFWNEYLVFYVKNYPARKFAKEVIHILKQKHQIYIISSRNEWGLPSAYIGKMEELTKQWLKKNEIEYDELILTGEKKLPVCIEKQIDVMIDDSPYIIEEIAGNIKAICFDASYNEKVKNENSIRVYSWYDILSKIG